MVASCDRIIHNDERDLPTINATQTEALQSTAKLTNEDLRQFTGDLERFFHTLNRKVVYTPGVRHVAQAGQAYWLIDAIASYFGSEQMMDAMQRDYRLKLLQFWRLEVQDGSAVLTAIADVGEEPFVRQDRAV